MFSTGKPVVVMKRKAVMGSGLRVLEIGGVAFQQHIALFWRKDTIGK